MASILKVDTIQDQAGNNIISENANVITIGASGDTITVPAGATVSGFTSAGIDDNATSTAITISSLGLVGIGTTSPNHKFELLGGSPSVSIKSDNTTNGSSNIIFGDTDDDDIGKIFYEHGTNSFRFLTNASERMRIDSSGNVGIGTTAPESPLHVVGTNTLFSPLRIQGASGNGTSLLSARQDATADRVTLGLAWSSASFVIGNRVKPSNSSESDATGFLSSSASNTARNAIKMNTNGAIQFYNASASTTAVNTAIAMTERFRINSDGNIGIGTSTPAHNLEIVATASGSINDSLQIRNNTTTTGSGSRLRFITSTDLNSDTNGASIASVRNGNDNDLVFEVENAEAMRIDHAGKVGIGTSSPGTNLDVNGNVRVASGNALHFGNSSDYRIEGSNVTNPRIGFVTNGSERMRIRSDGAVHIGTVNHAQTDFKYNTNYTDGNMARFENTTSTNPYGIAMSFPNASPDDNTRYFLFCNDSSTVRLRIDSDGDVKNHDNSYGALSDERIKQDIRDSNSQWDDIKNIKVRNFKKKDDVRQYGENAWEQIGVIAQELETVSPKLIKHSDPTPSDILSDASFGTLYEEGDEIPEDKKVGDVKEVHQQVKGVSYSVLYMKSIKALQEAMERIETLEAKVQTLETNNP